jgi:dihydrolipoamide dehydrogenase
VASVGFTEKEASHLTLRIGTFPFKASSKARCAGEEEGFVKIITEASSERILGVHILGAHASELIAQGALALQHRFTLSDLIATPYAHPTLSESLKEAALAVRGSALHK